MYQNTQPLPKQTQYTQLQSYPFASTQNFCPVFFQELPQLIREYFICFPNNQTDLPHAILGFEKGVNKYVEQDGSWLADYVPAYIRRYPFILAKVEGKQDLTLAADMDAPHFKQDTGEPLFTEDGQPTNLLHEKINLLKAIEHQRSITQKAVQELDQAGVFKMEQMTVKSGDQAVSSIGGLRMVDEDKLAKSGLKAGPALQLAYAHIFSQANLRYGVLAGKKAEPKSATSEDQDVDIEQLFGDDATLNFDNI